MSPGFCMPPVGIWFSSFDLMKDCFTWKKKKKKHLLGALPSHMEKQTNLHLRSGLCTYNPFPEIIVFISVSALKVAWHHSCLEGKIMFIPRLSMGL